MIILVDMDNTIANFDKHILEVLSELYPNFPKMKAEERTEFYFAKNYPEEWRPQISGIYNREGFFYSLPEIEGAFDALDDMLSQGHDVFLCTSPLTSNPYCLEEKNRWVSENMGAHWSKRLIIAKDKTLIFGDYLIDDKPKVEGILVPKWEHILYDQPYNRNSKKRRLDWNNWRDILELWTG